MVVVNHVSQSSLGVCINLAITFYADILQVEVCIHFLGPLYLIIYKHSHSLPFLFVLASYYLSSAYFCVDIPKHLVQNLVPSNLLFLHTSACGPVRPLCHSWGKSPSLQPPNQYFPPFYPSTGFPAHSFVCTSFAQFLLLK
jgi:hypothetical protein